MVISRSADVALLTQNFVFYILKKKRCCLPPVVGHALERGAGHVHGDHLALAALALVPGKLPRELLVISGLKQHSSLSLTFKNE